MLEAWRRLGVPKEELLTKEARLEYNAAMALASMSAFNAGFDFGQSGF
jgi:hypothetical protein